MEAMGKEVIIDTDIIVDALRGKKESEEYLKSRQIEGIYISSITAFELLFGAMKSQNEQNKQKTELFIDRVHVLEFDAQTAHTAAEIHTQLSGKEIDFRDLFIAATAIQHNYSLKTNNKKHFSRVPNLHIA